MTVVLVHAGDVSLTSHRSNDEVLKVAEPEAESFARGDTD
jgi:hypothetical protein